MDNPASEGKGVEREGKPNLGKEKAKSVKFAFLKTSENDPISEEVSGNHVNIATRNVDLSDMLGGDAWGSKNRPEERSVIIDTGFNGGGLCSFSRLRKYLEYLESFTRM